MVQVSVSAGAVLAGAGPEDIRACEIYAEKIGLAFQSKNSTPPYVCVEKISSADLISCVNSLRILYIYHTHMNERSVRL